MIVMEYLVPSTGKLYHHKIRLNKLNKDTKSEEAMREIYEKHSAYLDNKKVYPQQMLSKIHEKI
jgi:centrosomal protein CEP19